ncbi:MAG TPA: acyl-CoA dehydrogenase [Acidiferrobacteraceae bacterium]|nr:acyl-CoA dehydrogenase [Acidiferrobacteraceae bacterium]
MNTLIGILLLVGVLWTLAYLGTSLLITTGITAATLLVLTLSDGFSSSLSALLWLVFLVVTIPLNIPNIRRIFLSTPLLKLFRKIMPAMSDTEREAIEAGTVWWDAELFSGRPRWKILLDYPKPKLSAEEQAFVDGPTEELCSMLHDYQISEDGDLPKAVWNFIKKNQFFGMVIPKKYGGLEFSALAHSAVVMKISSRSITTAVTVMVPNSLGPAELLYHYGTEKQKDHYLPRLAAGKEVPCFALTGPEAGSDAGAMPDTGIVCKDRFDGKPDVLGIRLNWSKRYITLGPVATVLGLAFKLYDPDHLIGDQDEWGITCALIPTDTAGISIGDRHNPLNLPFMNGPNYGKDVFIPMDWIIGGQARAGQGWRMLMERLAVGRGISLPALSVGGCKLASRAIGGYARIRRQFKLPIGRFEGVEEALARIAGYTYMVDAARTLSTTAVDLGEKAAVMSAIVKYNLTEYMRQSINDAMDVQGGAGICLGPRNVLGKAYQGIPISITVEGANILTRSLITYGQGAIRCHPYVLEEMHATANPDEKEALERFDPAFFGHVGFVFTNLARALLLGLTHAWFTRTPGGAGRRYYQHLNRFSAAFALMSDVAMLVLGGALKRKEKISGRFADVLSHLYLASAVLKRFEEQGQQATDQPLMQWACEHALYRIQEGLDGVLRNFPVRPVAWLMRPILFPLGRRFAGPSDRLGHKVVQLILSPSEARDRLTAGIYIPSAPEESLAKIEDALVKVIAAEEVEKILRQAVKDSSLTMTDSETLLGSAVAQNIITDEQADRVRAADAARLDVIQVDAFSPSEASSEVPPAPVVEMG